MIRHQRGEASTKNRLAHLQQCRIGKDALPHVERFPDDVFLSIARKGEAINMLMSLKDAEAIRDAMIVACKPDLPEQGYPYPPGGSTMRVTLDAEELLTNHPKLVSSRINAAMNIVASGAGTTDLQQAASLYLIDQFKVTP